MDLTTKSSIAHDLEAKIWRSQDVDPSKYNEPISSQIEIRTPSNNPDFVLKNSNKNTTFSLMKIDREIVDNLKRCGFVWPSPIQTTCIPIARLGIDLIAQSKSGTGKTIVFVVCALEMIRQDLQNEVPCPKVLILAPTREIAVQIGDLINVITSGWENFSCYKAIGGTKVSDDVEQLYHSQIVVGTPGRIVSLIEMNFLKPHSIRLFVLDECDKLMEENFKIQIDKIYNRLPINKQMIVTSATMSDEMTEYLSKYMRDPALIRMNADKPSLIGVAQYTLMVDGHCLDYMNFESKISPLLEVLNSIQFNQCFVFLNYQTRVKYLYERLNSEGLSVIYITGDMSQKERSKAIEMFRSQRYKIFVSTDLTSRGIDIESVNLVINVDVPIDCETYLHRIGRAGRFGSSGLAITIVGHDSNECDKFSATLSQYNLETKRLHLPLAIDPWEYFRRENSHSPDGFLSSSTSTTLKVNPLFKQLECLYKKLLKEPESIVHYNFKAPNNHINQRSRKPLSQILEQLTLQKDGHLMDKENNSTIKNQTGSDKFESTMIKSSLSNKHDPTPPESFAYQNIRNDNDNDENISIKRENDHLNIISHAYLNNKKVECSNIQKHSSKNVSSAFTQQQHLQRIFHQTFLNPMRIINHYNPTNCPVYEHLNNNHHYQNQIHYQMNYICRFLLNGGKFS